MEIYYTQKVNEAFQEMHEVCKKYRHEFVMPEHFVMALLKQYEFNMTLIDCNVDLNIVNRSLMDFFDKTEQVPDDWGNYDPNTSEQLREALGTAVRIVQNSSAHFIYVPHIVKGILDLNDSYAAYLLNNLLGEWKQDFMSELVARYADDHDQASIDEEDDEDEELMATEENWRKMVTCLNDTYQNHNPLIGRKQELERTIQVLCRKEKNNPLHIGEPGVGKTALVYGLAAYIEKGKGVPNRLKGSKIYQLDLGTLLAGTQFRGDFEKRIKEVMEGVIKEATNNIVYIDEIHNLVGAGATGEGSMDASNMLKPYLESGNIRFIGSTTYEEYNRHFARSKGLVRRFQQIDIAEPTEQETLEILKQLRPMYEEFHQVKYEDSAIEFAVRASAKYINERFLPDKAIDLIDEAGAAMESLECRNSTLTVKKSHIADILSKTCKVDALAMKEDDNSALETLRERISAKIYGQDEAVRQVVEAVQLSKAGLLDDNKPLASLLFVGPTGVGKTEVARVLAKELGIELLRFDMSEYTEKHTVAKLIGSPAGYVGYEDGGLLTDAIRKTPNCVLLLDEIEKAHQDIYNILLQVMDYARLTDNKGRKADFRNVILIMTSNAGAQYAAQASIGFSGSVSRGEAMLKQVKKTFKPEFINRLSGTVVFNDMDRTMATLILRKKLSELQEKLTAKQVEMTLSDEAFDYLLNEGFTREYGAREMDRVITNRLKPLLMREILFGSLKKGGKTCIGLTRTDTGKAQLSLG